MKRPNLKQAPTVEEADAETRIAVLSLLAVGFFLGIICAGILAARMLSVVPV